MCSLLTADSHHSNKELKKHKSLLFAIPTPIMSANVPPYFICPISKQIMDDPVIWMDGNTYERREIERWLEKHKINTTRSDLAYRNILFPNRGAKAGIEAFLVDHGGGGLGKRKASQEESTDIPDRFICPLSERIMDEPVICADGVTYERSEIERWLVVCNISPSTGQLLQNKSLTADDRLSAEMNAFGWRKYVAVTHELHYQVLVKTPRDRVLLLSVRPNTLIADIKQLLHRRGEGPPEQQRLMFEGKVLSDEGKAIDCHVGRGGTVLLTQQVAPVDSTQTPNMREVADAAMALTRVESSEIFVKTLAGRTITIPMHPADSVDKIKQRLHQRGEKPPEEQRLVFAGLQLEDGRTMRDYNIQKESTLYLLLRLCGC